MLTFCQRCQRTVDDDHFKNAHRYYAEHDQQAPKPIDWPAEARKAAMMLWASKEYDDVGTCCDHAETLIAEMKRREAFGGGG